MHQLQVHTILGIFLITELHQNISKRAPKFKKKMQKRPSWSFIRNECLNSADIFMQEIGLRPFGSFFFLPNKSTYKNNKLDLAYNLCILLAGHWHYEVYKQQAMSEMAQTLTHRC